MAHGAKLRFEPGSWQEAVYDVYIGFVVGAAHVFYFVRRLVVNPILNAFGIHLGKDTANGGINTERRLKVVGVGFGRTGTVRCDALPSSHGRLSCR